MCRHELLEYLIFLTYKVDCLIKQSYYNDYLKHYIIDNQNKDPKSENKIFNSINTNTIKAVIQPKIKEIVSYCKKSVELIPNDCQEKFYAKILRSSAQKINDFIPELEKDYDSYNDYLNVVNFFLLTLGDLYEYISDYLSADINKNNMSREKSRVKINKAYASVKDLKLIYKPICLGIMKQVYPYGLK